MKKKIITTPFDRNKIPPKQNIILVLIIWLVCFLETVKHKLKITKVRMKGLKPPFLVISAHCSFTDFYIIPLVLFPYRANYVGQIETFEAYGEWLYRHVGCLGTRKYINDLALVKNIKRVINRKGILVIYPEARYSNIGTNSKLEESVGKLCKMLKVPVVSVNMHGSYLRSPIWGPKVRKEVKLEAIATQVFTAEELEKASYQEINKKLQEHLTYDDYKWQFDTKLKITYEKRAEGIELALYLCPCCEAEFKMEAKNAEIFCSNCEARWQLSEYGNMEPVNPALEYKSKEINFSHIPNWYEWQRSQVVREIEAGKYLLNIKVQVESLPNAVNFIDLGEGLLTHNEKGFALTFKDYGETKKKTLYFEPLSMSSVHTEYSYRDKSQCTVLSNYYNKGQCITLSTLDNTYFLYPRGMGFNPTKIQFATEYMYERAKNTTFRKSL
jgi:1-acyl-sn-glycerol-3-phosphate acyltransferase